MSYRTGAICGLMLLGAEASFAAPRPGPVSVRASTRACVAGQPVSVVFRVAHPVGTAVVWRGVDKAFGAVTLLKSETRALNELTSQHEVFFTMAQGGRCEVGPFPVLLQGQRRADTLYAPVLRVQFRAEARRPALHPLRPILPVWQGLDYKQSWGWEIAGLLLVGVGVGGLLFRKPRRGLLAAAPPLLPAQAQQLALDKLALLEQDGQVDTCSREKLPEQLLGIVNAYLTQLPGPVASATDGSPHQTAAMPAAAAGRPVALAAMLAELDQARFAPTGENERRANALVATARLLVTSWDGLQQTQPR